MREERTTYALQQLMATTPGISSPLAGSLEDLKVPVAREGDLHPRILSYHKQASLELSEAILAIYAVSVSTRKISAFLKGIDGAFYSPQSISRLIEVTQEQVRAWQERPLSTEYYAVFLDRTFLPIRRGRTVKDPCASPWGSSLLGEGRSSGFGFSVRKGRALGIGRRCSRVSSDVGSNGCGSLPPTNSQA